MTTYTADETDAPRAYTQEEVQNELFEHLAYLLPYWVNSTHYAYENSPIHEKLSGMMHSFYVALSGMSGGVNVSFDMRVHSTKEQIEKAIAEGRNYFPEGLDESYDINDGNMKYQSAEMSGEVDENGSDGPREWGQGEAREIFYTRVSEIFHEWVDKKGVSDMDKGAGLIRSIFDLCEGNNPKFDATISLIASPHPDDKEHYLENGENYYEEETFLSTPQRSLTQAWDAFWEKAKHSPNGL
jgi:hypothetical protein